MTGRPARRFEEYFLPEPNTGCWLWVGATSGGYGTFWYQGRVQKAHRVSWIKNHGEIAGNMLVCHHCDTPACVNPAHLFLGTAQDNMADRQRKLRFARPNAKITQIQAGEIRASVMSPREIAPLYGLKPETIWYIRSGKRWKVLAP